MVKRLALFVDRVFDMAEDLRLPPAAATLVKAVQGLKHENCRGLLHVTISPTPRAGKVNPDILLNGLGPVGSHVIPQDIWDQIVPPDSYCQGLRDFNVETPWVDARGNDPPNLSYMNCREMVQCVPSPFGKHKCKHIFKQTTRTQRPQKHGRTK